MTGVQTCALPIFSNSAYNQANVANTVAYAAIPKSNGTATGTLTIVNLFTSGSCSFLGYHTIDQYGGIFRTGVSGYGVRIYPNGPSTQAILQFTDTYQSTQFGSIFANSSTLSIGTDTLNSVTNIRANGSTVGTFSSSGLLVTGQIDVTGDIIAFYSSDINLKENITVIDNALEKVKQIRGVEYDWKAEHLDIYPSKDKHDVGVIAQEIEKVLPDIVTTRDDGIKAVRYEKIVPLLIEAIKELSDKVERLENVISK